MKPAFSMHHILFHDAKTWMRCRTYKVEHLQKQPWAEACWYFTESREQFRLGGNLTIVGEDHPDEALRKARVPLFLHVCMC
jgi:hypothetical protein